MAENNYKTWRELCDDAIAANDADKLLALIHQLEAELNEEEKIRRQVANEDPIGKLPRGFLVR